MIRLWIGAGSYSLHTVVERTRDYPSEAFNDLFAAMDGIEQRHGLIPALTEAEEAAVAAAEEKLARGEPLAERKLSGPIEDFLPESHESVLARLSQLPETERGRNHCDG